MPEWYWNKDCLSYEAHVDQRINNWRAQIKDIEDSIKSEDLKTTFQKIKEFMKHQNPNPFVRSLLTEDGKII